MRTPPLLFALLLPLMAARERTVKPPKTVFIYSFGNGRLHGSVTDGAWRAKELGDDSVGSIEALGVNVHAMNIPNGDIAGHGVFDAVILAHVLEHLPDPAFAMKLIAQLLRPGGVGRLRAPEDRRHRLVLPKSHDRRESLPKAIFRRLAPGHCQEF